MRENTYDGFDRIIRTTDAVGNVVDMDGTAGSPCLDLDGRMIISTTQRPTGGSTPTERNGTNNVDLTESVSQYDGASRRNTNTTPLGNAIQPAMWEETGPSITTSKS